MACFAPLYGWQKPDGGQLYFGAERPNTRKVDIPCGHCLGCRLARARAWAIRCMHESQMHDRNCFITLTYNEENYRPGLNYHDFWTFLKRVKRAKGPTRFFMCGEYGEQLKRPHFHALLFGQTFEDAKNYGRTNISETLTKLWGKGYASVDECNYETAGYVARYSVKKVYGPRAADHYRRVDLHSGEIVNVSPEFAKMSLRPAIGKTWFEKYWKEVYVPRDGIVLKGGKTITAPRYYDNLLMKMDSDLREYKDYERYIKSKEFLKDCTPERLKVRETIARANLERQRRNLEL